MVVLAILSAFFILVLAILIAVSEAIQAEENGEAYFKHKLWEDGANSEYYTD